jgi:tetratricopeptide (TPR) repeat protein
MKSLFPFTKIFAIIVFMLFVFATQAQDKNIAKVDEYIAKAKSATDAAKKTEWFNKASEIIMTNKLGKEQFVKIGDAYLEEGDITNAAKYFMRCDKTDKAEGYVKIGHKMVEQAFDDPKAEAKTMRKAIDYFTKGGAAKEGYEAVGDAYYEKGKDSYLKAADYYAQGGVAAKLEKIAGEFLSDNKPDLAADVYMKANTPEGYKKAGDLYFSAGEYNDAFTAYEKAGYAEGIKKYADKLYQDGQVSDAEAQYNKVADMYAAKSNVSGLNELAQSAENRGNYAMAAALYEKAGDNDKAGKARAYDRLFALDFDGAKSEFTTLGNADMVKAITANMKFLTPLKDAAEYFDEVKRAEPPVSYVVDTVTKKKTPVKTDIDAFNSYYKEAMTTIVDNCYIVSANVPKILHAGLKEAMMKRFKQYGAVRNILDSNFGKKLSKEQITVKDIVL